MPRQASFKKIKNISNISETRCLWLGLDGNMPNIHYLKKHLKNSVLNNNWYRASQENMDGLHLNVCHSKVFY